MSLDIKYIGMDVHKESTSIAVMNSIGKIVMSEKRLVMTTRNAYSTPSRRVGPLRYSPWSCLASTPA